MPKIYTLNTDIYSGSTSLNLLAIRFLDIQIDYDKFNSIIFTSKNAIRSIKNDIEKCKNLDIYSIGTATTKELNKLNIHPTLTSKMSHANEFAHEIKEDLKDKNVLYPRAKNIGSNLIQILKYANVNIEDKTVYESFCQAPTIKSLELNSAVIFSSPSTVKCFFKHYKWHDTLKAIAIGSTTAKELANFIDDYKISPIQDIDECIKNVGC